MALSPFIEITPQTHDVFIDIAYATPNNFTGQPVYKSPRCYLHPDAHDALLRAIKLADAQGLKFKIFDAYRPTEAQWILWQHTPDPNFLADPAKGSPHSRGVAIDLTLCDKNGVALDMGTAFDAFMPQSHHGAFDISAKAQANRLLLLGIMTLAGWDFYRNEWWHYQLFNARATYPLWADKDAGTEMM